MPGQVIDPPVDRQRGYTAVLVHLRNGPPPNPDGINYNILAMGPEKVLTVDPRREMELGTPTIFSGRARRAMPRPKSVPRPSPRNAGPAVQP